MSDPASSDPRASPPGFFRVLGLLLETAQRRGGSRRHRNKEILRHQSGAGIGNWGCLAAIGPILMLLWLNVSAGLLTGQAVTGAQRIETIRNGKLVVADAFAAKLLEAQTWAMIDGAPSGPLLDHMVRPLDHDEAKRIAEKYGGDTDVIERRLRTAIRDRGPSAFISESDAEPGLPAPGPPAGLPAMFGSIVLLVWSIALVMQGEGLDFDLQRRRHPAWEWLLSHPIRPAPMFCAEMLAPLAANPVFWSAPLMPAIIYGQAYGFASGLLAMIVVGIPITVSAACLGKAIEISALLRAAVRTRGTILGLVGWLGYCTMMPLLGSQLIIDKLVPVFAAPMQPLARLPWPVLGLFLGRTQSGSVSFARGVLTCLLISVLVIGCSIAFSVWSARRGLAAPADQLKQVAGQRQSGASRYRFGRDPLYRKELLWFARDRSAVIQTLLVPLTVAAFQLFNLRTAAVYAGQSWNALCGAAILFGTYFIAVLGPKSLASEGAALWIALTWPRGLESLLRAKARLWTLLSSCIVGLILCFAVFTFPAAWWRVALVGAAWVVFARSMANKAVTLASVAGPGGEPAKIPSGRSWAVQIGTFSFSVGVLTQQWPLAVTGMVYSTVAAAAMWQNFRGRLPYLYDPWSETLPQAPTLLHAMVAIQLMLEIGAVVGVAGLAIGGHAGLAITNAVAYGASAACVSVGLAIFLARRGASMAKIWNWRDRSRPSLLKGCLAGCATGLGLGLLAAGYDHLLLEFQWSRSIIEQAATPTQTVPYLYPSLLVMAVLFAPPAEEFLFRGLLFRALDREWGARRAIAGSAAFFAIYHPVLSWLPVAALGVANALLFKRTGNLLPAILSHMVYNAVVLA